MSTPEPTPRSRRASRWASAVAVSAAVAGAGVLTVGWTTGASNDAPVVLEADDARAARPPATVAPVEPVAAVPGPSASPTTTVSPTITDTAAPSSVPTGTDAATEAVTDEAATDRPAALADLVGPRYSARPESIEPMPVPVRLAVDSIDVARYPVRAVGLEPDGQLEIPDETEIGWYRYGSTAGRAGATVLAAHVSWNRTVGPFAELGLVEPGDRVEVTLDEGTTRIYEVVERTMYDKDELPRERIWRTTGDETLVLITCGGDFNPDIRRYRQNIVVYAVPVA